MTPHAKRRAAWMAEFERHVLQIKPEAAGRIIWDEASYLFNVGRTPEDAAKTYAERHDELRKPYDGYGRVSP